MTPYTFASSTIVVSGLLGFCLIFFVPPLGLALFALAAGGAYLIAEDRK